MAVPVLGSWNKESSFGRQWAPYSRVSHSGVYSQELYFLFIYCFFYGKKPVCFVFEWGSPLERGKSRWTSTHSVALFVSLEAGTCLCFVLKGAECSNYHLKKGLWGTFWIRDLIIALNSQVRGRGYLTITICGRSACADPHRGSGRVILGPCAPCAAVLAVLITPFMVSCAVGIFKTPRPNLRVYLEFSICSLAFLFHFMWCYFSIHSQISSLILQTFTDIRWKKVIGKKKKTVCSCPKVGQSKEQQKGFTSFLKSPKHTSRNRSVFSINTSIRI